jgi:ADP-ribosyl-[dinitrogen reductase] hydrolase
MNEASVPEIGLEQIDAVLEYLPIFERPGYQAGEWRTYEGGFPNFAYCSEVADFIQTLYEQDFIIYLDWTGWREHAERYQSGSASLAEADLHTLRKLLTVHVRADRFVEGHLAGVFASGHIAAILRRLEQVRGEMAERDTGGEP